MQGKAGGALAVGAVIAVTSYLSTGPQGDPARQVPGTPSRTSFATSSAIPARPDAAEGRAYQLVTVFYATDRAVANGGRSGPPHGTWAISAAGGLGFFALAAWLALCGRRKLAWATGAAGMATAVGVLALGRWMLWDDRASGDPSSIAARYGPDRGELELGSCDISIPRSHQVGKLEQPSLLRLELQARPDRHVMVQRVTPQADDAFFAALRRRVEASPRRDVFVFVHGYNVTFESAARRTAQIAHDLPCEGAPVFYSWPSQGKTWKYTVDEANVAWTVPHLKRFLTDISQRSGAQSINLLAHSMGNRALTQAIRELAYELRGDQVLFDQVILAAPDIDADVFREQIAPSLTRRSQRVTLYASASDEALAASKLVHGAPRAGESTPRPLVVPGVDTIDVSLVDMGLLGHSYYGSSQFVLRDLATILHEARRAANRPWLEPVGNDPKERYWLYAEPTERPARKGGESTSLR